jgi:hypothetical protein
MDETYICVKGGWRYSYRAADKDGKTVDFLLRPVETRLGYGLRSGLLPGYQLSMNVQNTLQLK